MHAIVRTWSWRWMPPRASRCGVSIPNRTFGVLRFEPAEAWDITGIPRGRARARRGELLRSRQEEMRPRADRHRCVGRLDIPQLGRASCRERCVSSVDLGGRRIIKKKNNRNESRIVSEKYRKVKTNTK